MPDSSHSNSERPFSEQPKRSALDRFLTGISESVFLGKLGVADIQMVDYLSDLLLRFVRSDALCKVRRGTGEPVTEVYQMLQEGQKRIGLARREVHRHIGDFTLFWSGMYPESLRRPSKSSVDGFLDYCQQGKRAYAIAAEIEGGAERPPCELLIQLSEQFDLCAYGLREIRRAWEEDEDDAGGLLLH
ncbi:hypothetical protein SH139x_004120 [Planctomycetaceae bacterium SH139]